MQACINQYPHNGLNKQSSFYKQGVSNRAANADNYQPKQMRLLFSGNGKADRNMGMAEIPPLCPFELKMPYN